MQSWEISTRRLRGRSFSNLSGVCVGGGGIVTFERGIGLNFSVKFLVWVRVMVKFFRWVRVGVRGLRGVMVMAVGIAHVMKIRARGAGVNGIATTSVRGTGLNFRVNF